MSSDDSSLDQTLIQSILSFWFGSETVDLPSKKSSQLWFGGNPDVDQTISEKFSHPLQEAIAGQYDSWAKTARSSLALIILLDQFSRNIYRGSSNAFAQDPKALQLTLVGMEHGHDQNLSLLERVFYYLPLEHSEDLSIQKRSLEAFSSLRQAAPPKAQAVYESFYGYAYQHYQVIARFGRYPTRNAALGRSSTTEELEYLSDLKTVV